MQTDSENMKTPLYSVMNKQGKQKKNLYQSHSELFLFYQHHWLPETVGVG